MSAMIFNIFFWPLNCQIEQLPIRYLGLPLSLKKLCKEDFQRLIDKLRDRLGPWRTGFLFQSSRLILVQAAIPIFHLMSLDPPLRVFKATDKIRRAFLWKGADVVNGGHCLVSWKYVCRPKECGLWWIGHTGPSDYEFCSQVALGVEGSYCQGSLLEHHAQPPRVSWKTTFQCCGSSDFGKRAAMLIPDG